MIKALLAGLLAILFTSAPVSAGEISRAYATYPSLPHCIEQVSLSSDFFLIASEAAGITDIEKYATKSSNQYVLQIFYTEKNTRLFTVFVCHLDGTSQTTTFNMD